MKVFNFPLDVQQDTLHHQATTVTEETVKPPADNQQAEVATEETPLAVEEVPEHKPRQRHSTYEVLRQLPADATPAQQDSAIQAMFHPERAGQKASRDSLSQSADTIHSDTVCGGLPLYYRENFFSTKSLYHPELVGSRYGVAGDPQPYSIRNDDLVTGLLLGCFILTLIAFARSRAVLIRQFKIFFRVPHSEDLTSENETSGELRFLFFLVGQWALLCALLSFFYTQKNIADTFILQSQYQLIGIFMLCFVGYYLLRSALYFCVNKVFFDSKKNEQWQKAQLFITSMMGISLFPLIMLQSYFDLSIQSAIIYAASVLIIVKILTFYKMFVIFFRQNAFRLQIILYFCTLEIVPVLILLGFLVMIVDNLKINF